MPVLTQQQVITILAEKLIVAGIAFEGVVSRPAEDRVVAGIADEFVVEGVADDQIIAAAADDVFDVGVDVVAFARIPPSLATLSRESERFSVRPL